MSIKSKPKLLIELIPKTCHYSNVRTTVSKQEWDKIRFISYAVADNKCEICGDVGTNQGYKHNVECHEIWSDFSMPNLPSSKTLWPSNDDW